MAEEAVGITEASQRRRVWVDRFWGKRCRAYDHDNWVGGGKYILDALRANGLLLDDDENGVQAFYRQTKSQTGKEFVRVTLEEMEWGMTENQKTTFTS